MFAVHAFVLSVIGLAQIYKFDGFAKQKVSKFCLLANGFMGFAAFLYAFLIFFLGSPEVVDESSYLTWLDFTYVLSYMKMVITLIKYLPQVRSNFQRQSTSGWNIWNVILDFTGGTLSTAQLLLDCLDMNDFSGIYGDIVKFGLGCVSIIFDIIFMVQHYILYSHNSYDDDDDDDDLLERKSLSV